jgi:ABC-type polysaccharide/polyol phosphate export permease
MVKRPEDGGIATGSRVEAFRVPWDGLITLALADLRDRFGRGPARVAKWLVDPYAVAGVYLVLVTFILDRGGEAPGLSVACAVVPFHLVLTSAVNSMRSVRDRRSLLLNLGFPRALLPPAVTLTEALGFAASLSLLAVMMAVYGIAPTVAVLWLVPTIAVTLLFAIALSYPATLFGVWYRDLLPFAISAMRVLYFLAPGIVALSEIQGDANELVRINPLTGIFEAYRDALLYGQAPAAWELLYPAGFALALLAVCAPIFRSEQRHFAKVA